MKNLLIALILFASPLTSFAFTLDRVPPEYEITQGSQVTITANIDSGETFPSFDDASINDCLSLYGVGNCSIKIFLGGVESAGNNDVFSNDCNIAQSGNNLVVGNFENLGVGYVESIALFVYSDSSCLNIWHGLELESYGGDPDFVFIIIDSQINNFQLMVDEGDTVMQTVTGENMASNVSYAGTTFYKPFIAAGLSVLYYLRYWIVALVIISAIVFFYRRVKFKKT